MFTPLFLQTMHFQYLPISERTGLPGGDGESNDIILLLSENIKINMKKKITTINCEKLHNNERKKPFRYLRFKSLEK